MTPSTTGNRAPGLWQKDPLWDMFESDAKKLYGCNRDGSPLKGQKKRVPAPLIGNGVLGLSTTGTDFAKASKPIPVNISDNFTRTPKHYQFKHLSSRGNRRVAQGVRARRGNYKMAKADTGRTQSPELRMGKGRKGTPQQPKAPNPGKLETSGLGSFKPGTFFRERNHTFIPQEATSHLNAIDRFHSQWLAYYLR